MANYLKKYGVWEYVLFLFGLSILIKIAYGFITDTIENTAINGIAFLAAVLCIAAPISIVEISKSKGSAIAKIPGKITKIVKSKTSKNGTDE
ncbi:hypothetical protein [uncultured Aquimarina sp.]|uniref:hypothetical protein n=1 Tax=uncultured Aquimarina sp. TaxID=575652 RepID=UPI0026098E15|nr:hypothetical protein [uncultured Aquimarina sp.]